MKKFIAVLLKKSGYDPSKLALVLVLIIALIVMVLMFTSILSLKRQARDQQATIGAMVVNNKSYTARHLTDSTVIYQQQQLIFAKDQIIHSLHIDSVLQGLKNVTTAIKIKQKVTTGKVYIPSVHYIDPKNVSSDSLPSVTPDRPAYYGVRFDLDSSEYWHIPDTFKIKNKWIDLNLSLNKKGLSLDSGTLYNSQTIIIADKKLGFLKAPTPIVQVTNSNKYFNILSMENGTVKVKQPVYKRPVVWMVLGTVAGILIGSKL